jgi:importin subunit alpha-6/7
MESKSTRAKDFKKGVTQDDGRRRREASAIAIRKEKKEEGLSKRRNLAVESSESLPQESNDSVAADSQKKRVYSAADIPELFNGLQSVDVNVQLESLRGFRRLLSIDQNAPIRECIDCGAMPLFVNFLQRVDRTDLQFEAAWVLTNIASSNETEVVVKYNAIPSLTQLLLSVNADVREQVTIYSHEL